MIFQPQIVGKPLPALTNPGTAADLLSGKQLIDANGNVLTGTLVNREVHTVTVQGSGTDELQVQNVEQRPIMVVVFSENDIPNDSIVSSVQLETNPRFSQIARKSSGSVFVFDAGGFTYSPGTKILSIEGFLSYVYSSEIQYVVAYA